MMVGGSRHLRAAEAAEAAAAADLRDAVPLDLVLQILARPRIHFVVVEVPRLKQVAWQYDVPCGESSVQAPALAEDSGPPGSLANRVLDALVDPGLGAASEAKVPARTAKEEVVGQRQRPAASGVAAVRAGAAQAACEPRAPSAPDAWTLVARSRCTPWEAALKQQRLSHKLWCARQSALRRLRQGSAARTVQRACRAWLCRRQEACAREAATQRLLAALGSLESRSVQPRLRASWARLCQQRGRAALGVLAKDVEQSLRPCEAGAPSPVLRPQDQGGAERGSRESSRARVPTPTGSAWGREGDARAPSAARGLGRHLSSAEQLRRWDTARRRVDVALLHTRPHPNPDCWPRAPAGLAHGLLGSATSLYRRIGTAYSGHGSAGLLAECPDGHQLTIEPLGCRGGCQNCGRKLGGLHLGCAAGKFHACPRCVLAMARQPLAESHRSRP